MCGIAGLIRKGSTAPDDVAVVSRMTDAQVHRGPDDSGMYSDTRVALGHRRLSIIDLSTAGRQPMSNEDSSIWVTYNGEIYNFRELRAELSGFGHVFQSHADTEVLVHGYEQWGIEGLLGRLRGMFAFGLYDAERGLIIARDRLGIKPLYYYDGPEFLMFASEVKALLASGRIPSTMNREALAGFLLAGSVPAPLTTVQGVLCLPPGHYAVWRAGALSLHRYWDLEYDSQPGADYHGLRPELEDAVARHLISDVPLGVFLSGGVDSAALVALARRARQSELVTLTVDFSEQAFSEASAARQIAAHFDTRHHAVRVSSGDFQRELPAILAAMDQPTNDGVNTYFVSQAAREAGLKVVLSGAGGDEIFWGYRHYRRLGATTRWLRQCPGLARNALLRGAVTWGHMRGRENWTRLGYLDRQVSSQGLYLSLRGFFGPAQVLRLLGISQKELGAAVEQQFGPRRPLSADGFNYLETKRYLHDQLLRDTDVFSMAHSLEVRVPFLDHKIVEYAARVRPSRKVSDGVMNKPLLVDAVDDPMLREAGARKKRGFSFPMDQWMKGYANELEELAGKGDALDRAAVHGMWREFRAGRLHWSRAWALTVLGAAA